jgi:hypothetical protein
MRVAGLLLALFGAGGLVTGVMRLVHSMHVEPMGMALLALMAVGGGLMVGLGNRRARAERGPELAVLKVAKQHGGRVTAVLVAAEAEVPIEVAERELAALAESGACVRRTDDAGPCFFFPELESEEVKRKLFFADEARRAQSDQKSSQKVGS